MIEVFSATELTDVELLRPAMEDAIRHPLTQQIIAEEVEENLGEIARFQSGESDKYFAVARTASGLVIGSMGLQPPVEVMLEFTSTDSPIELINAYVSKESRGSGAGRALVGYLEEKATRDGHTELVLNSGPRYMRSGWPFWRKVYGEPRGKIKDFYGTGFDAMVWGTYLSRDK